MISQAAAYSLRAVLCLAADDGQWLTTRQIASRTGVPASYLAKLLQLLARDGLVASQRGLGGGHCLKRPADQISLMDVVHVADRTHRTPTAQGNGRSFALGPGFDRIVQAFEKELSRVSVSTVLAELPEPAA